MFDTIDSEKRSQFPTTFFSFIFLCLFTVLLISFSTFRCQSWRSCHFFSSFSTIWYVFSLFSQRFGMFFFFFPNESACFFFLSWLDTFSTVFTILCLKEWQNLFHVYVLVRCLWVIFFLFLSFILRLRMELNHTIKIKSMFKKKNCHVKNQY